MILCWVEPGPSGWEETTRGCLTMARGLAGRLGARLVAFTVGAQPDPVGLDELGRLGVEHVHVCAPDDPAYLPAAWGRWLAEAAGSGRACAVLVPGTDRGHEVLAHAAVRLGVAMVANVTEIGLDESGQPRRITRARWAGSVLEESVLPAGPTLASTAPHAVVATEVAVAGTPTVRVHPGAVDPADARVRLVEHIPPASTGVSLATARVVVGGGRGVGDPEGFVVLEQLASLLGGALGVSRAVTSAGWRPHTEQVGQTGTKIAPDLYIACGISGAIQHMAGCRSAKRILAINTDPAAPILAQASHAVVADVHQVVPALVEEITRRRANGGPDRPR